MALSSLSDILSLKSNSCLLTDYLFLIKKKKKIHIQIFFNGVPDDE